MLFFQILMSNAVLGRYHFLPFDIWCTLVLLQEQTYPKRMPTWEPTKKEVDGLNKGRHKYRFIIDFGFFTSSHLNFLFVRIFRKDLHNLEKVIQRYVLATIRQCWVVFLVTRSQKKIQEYRVNVTLEVQFLRQTRAVEIRML